MPCEVFFTFNLQLNNLINLHIIINIEPIPLYGTRLALSENGIGI
jgi:hypothetical protein